MHTMKALVKAELKSGLWLKEIPVPEIGADDILIKVHKTAICGRCRNCMAGRRHLCRITSGVGVNRPGA